MRKKTNILWWRVHHVSAIPYFIITSSDVHQNPRLICVRDVTGSLEPKCKTKFTDPFSRSNPQDIMMISTSHNRKQPATDCSVCTTLEFGQTSWLPITTFITKFVQHGAVCFVHCPLGKATQWVHIEKGPVSLKSLQFADIYAKYEMNEQISVFKGAWVVIKIKSLSLTLNGLLYHLNLVSNRVTPDRIRIKRIRDE